VYSRAPLCFSCIAQIWQTYGWLVIHEGFMTAPSAALAASPPTQSLPGVTTSFHYRSLTCTAYYGYAYLQKTEGSCSLTRPPSPRLPSL
jgi:hypothetical protein